jgi:hypothetical protein
LELGGIWEEIGRHLERLGRLLDALLVLQGTRGVLEQKCIQKNVFCSLTVVVVDLFRVDGSVVTITVYCACAQKLVAAWAPKAGR